MAVTLHGEIRGRSYSRDDEGGVIGAVRSWKVRSTDRSEKEDKILQAKGLPKPDHRHDVYPDLVAKRFQVEQDAETWWLWIVTVDYEWKFPEGDGQSPPTGGPAPRREPIDPYNPEPHFGKQPEVWFDFNTYNRATDWAYPHPDTSTADTRSVAIETEANDPFDPPLEFPVSDLIINIKRAEFLPNLGLHKDYQNAINQRPITFGDKALVKFNKYELRLSSRIGPDVGGFRMVEYILTHKEETWLAQPLHAGPNYIDDYDQVTKKPFLTAEGDPYIGKLEGFGFILGTDDPAGVPQFLSFRGHKVRNFNRLNLPRR